MTVIQSIDLITTDPQVRDGRPCVGGTSIRVIDIAMAQLFHQRTPDQISSDYGLSQAQVHAALSYYYTYKDELDGDIRRQIRTVQAAKEKHVGGISTLLSG